MKNLTISRIDPTNPVLATYVDKIKSWDEEGIIQITKDDNVVPFYALYYDAIFCGAGTIEFDRENSKAKVAMVNGYAYKNTELQFLAISQFEKLVSEQYGTHNIDFSYVKKRG